MSWQQRFEIERRDDVIVVGLLEPEPHDADLARELRDQLVQLVQCERPEQLIIDFSAVRQYPTAAISSLLSARKTLPGGDRIHFCGMCEEVELAYRFLNLKGTVFSIYESPSEALSAFCTAGSS